MKAIYALVASVVVALCVGWVMNIYALMHMDTLLSGIGALRVIGIFVAPLGGVIGYF